MSNRLKSHVVIFMDTSGDLPHLVLHLLEDTEGGAVWVNADNILSSISTLDESFRNMFDTDEEIDRVMTEMIAAAKTEVSDPGNGVAPDPWEIGR